MHYAVSIGMLGFTRLQSVVAYNGDTRAFDELTPAVARRMIKSGQIAGILWEEDKDTYDNGRFLPDKEGFNKQNIVVKTAAGKFRKLLNDTGVAGQTVNSMYSVVRIIKTNYRGVLYEVVSNRYDRIKLTESQLRGLNELEPVGGVWIHDDHIIHAQCIKVEDRTQPSGESTEQVESVESGASGESGASNENQVPADTEESVEPVENVENTEPVENAEPLTMEDVFGPAGAAEGAQASDNENQASDNESQDVDQAEPAAKMQAVFQTEYNEQAQNKNTESKAGGKNKKSAANKKK